MKDFIGYECSRCSDKPEISDFYINHPKECRILNCRICGRATYHVPVYELNPGNKSEYEVEYDRQN